MNLVLLATRSGKSHMLEQWSFTRSKFIALTFLYIAPCRMYKHTTEIILMASLCTQISFTEISFMLFAQCLQPNQRPYYWH